VWGLVKYHHDFATTGKIDMDKEFFRLLPSIVNAKNSTTLSLILENWIDTLNSRRTYNSAVGRMPHSKIAFLPDYGFLFIKGVINKSLQLKLQLVIDEPRSLKQHYIEMTPVAGNPIFMNEKEYKETSYPDISHRLLCLFRYWSTVQYFYPYRHMIGRNWTDVLTEFIPRFIAVKNEKEYLKTCLALISNIHDSHADISAPGITAIRGRFILPFKAKLIENKLMITSLYTDALSPTGDITPGDIIVAIDGESVDNLLSKYLPITPGSNKSVRIKDLIECYLLRSNKDRILIEIEKDGAGNKHWVNNLERNKVNHINIYPKRDTTSFKLLGQVGYINAIQYQERDFPVLRNLLEKTKGLVIDMRGYPKSNLMNTLIPFIKENKAPFYKTWKGSAEVPGLFTFVDLKEEPGQNLYRKKVIVIVNEETQSYPEFITMALQSSSNVKVLGSTTAGADGNMSFLKLPGGSVTSFSGAGIMYPDGTQSQRLGVKIDYVIKPTIKGIKLGQDEMLDSAINHILDR
jgi:hypothetical protein